MNESQEAHLERIKILAATWIDSKFRAGAEEHEGDLLDMPILTILDNAIDEAVDLFVYLASLRGKLNG